MWHFWNTLTTQTNKQYSFQRNFKRLTKEVFETSGYVWTCECRSTKFEQNFGSTLTATFRLRPTGMESCTGQWFVGGHNESPRNWIRFDAFLCETRVTPREHLQNILRSSSSCAWPTFTQRGPRGSSHLQGLLRYKSTAHHLTAASFKKQIKKNTVSPGILMDSFRWWFLWNMSGTEIPGVPLRLPWTST